ncbi:MAG: pre-peptidase C-terminal domain-containing protein, partial [Sulfurovum sp.]|nr:pre-peptidase C-terminal domain-containing protein [Sulfurovum sp.]
QKQAKFLFLAQDGKGGIETKGRAYGYSVRCIKAHTNERGKVSDVNIVASERSSTETDTDTNTNTDTDTNTEADTGTGTGASVNTDTDTEAEIDGTSEGLSSNGGGGTATIDPNRSPVRNKLIMEYIPDNNNVEYNTVTKRIRKIKNTADWDRNHVYDLLQTTGRSQPRLKSKNGNNYIFFNNDSKLVNAEVWVNDQANGTKKGFTENGTDMTIYVVANTLEMGNHTLLAWNKGEWKRDSINGRTNVTREYTTNIRMSLDLPRDTGRAVAFFGKFSDGESSTTLKSNILNNSEIFNQKFCWKFETHGTTRNLYKNFIKVASKTNAYSNLSRVNWGQFILGNNGRASKAKAYVYAVLVYRGRVSASDDEKIKNWIKSKFRISYIPVSINESTRVISDTNTQLQWQDNSDTGTVTKSWAGANTYCANLVFNGHDDWRLPTILELESVMSNAKKNRAFRYIITGRKYWATLATYVPTDHAWAIRKNGRRAWVTKTTPLYIRCVRGGTSGEISSDNNSNEGGTVTPVNPTSTTRGRFNAAEDTDYFKIVIPYTGTLLVETTGSTDTSGSLLDASGVQVASDNNSGTGANFKFLKRVTAGTYYVRVKRNSASSTGHYALVTHFNDHGGKITLATPINPNSATAGRIEKAGDVDWFRVTIPRGGGILTVKTTGTTDTVGTLYNASGTKITENDNGDLHSNFRISRTVAAGKYYVRVKHRSASSTGRYTLVSQFSDHGNSKTTATSINLNSTTAGNIEVAESADYFKIVIPRGGGRLTVNTTGSTNTRGALLDANGTQVASNDNSGPDRNFRISKSVPAGTYYVKVSASSTGHYELVSQFDDHGSGKRTATSITPNSTTPGSLEVVGDNDWFKIVVTNEGILAVETNSSLDTDITLYNASGYQIAFDDNSGSGNNAKIEKKVSSGTYYAKVKHHHSSKTGNYSFVVRLTPEDHGDTKAKATSIDLNSTTSGSLEVVGDNDWFKIVVTNAGALVVETTGSLDTDITLYNAGGTQVAFDDNSGSGNNAKIAKKVSSGTYYVKVNHHDSSETGNYLLVSQFIADDHGSTKETATLIAQTKVLTLAESRRYEPFERTVPGSIGFAGDEDWFKIVTTDIGNLTVKTTGSTDTGITLYDENNNEVPLDGNSTTRISGGTYSSTKGWPHTYYV